MSKELTEQWKKGELKVGECYFIRLKSGKIIPQMYSFVCIDGKHHCTDFGLSYGSVEEVLAPVPSYQEYLESESHCAVYSEVNELNKEKIEKLKKENAELLKKIEELENQNESLKQWFPPIQIDPEEVAELVQKKIDEVLK